VVVPNPPLLTRPEIDMIQKRVFFEWGTHYLAARKGKKWTSADFGPDFKLTDEDWTALRKTMDLRKVTLTDSIWTAEREFMHRQVRTELAGATLGALDRYKILLEDDPQLNSALELFPRASALMSGNFSDVGSKPTKAATSETSTPATAQAPLREGAAKPDKKKR